MAEETVIEILDFESISEIVNNHYDLGEVTSAIRIYNGYVNITNDIHILKNGQIRNYILRAYREGIQEDKVCFEHALINELRERGFVLSPRLVETRYQSTYAKVSRQLTHGRQELVIAIYQYLPGKDKYSWDNPLCSIAELSHAAGVLATYHNTIFGWRDTTGWKEPGIIDQIPSMHAMWKTYTDSPGDSVFDRYLIQHIHRLNESVDQVSTAIERSVYETLPHLIIHGDFHPGNLKFQDGTVAGLFDFDWSMLDARCFDVGLALTYFCTAWEENSDGNLLLDRVSMFLDGYQACAQEMKSLGGLSSFEFQYLPQMILAGTLYVLHWSICEFYTTLPDPDEYVRYLQHGVRSIKWFEQNWSRLVEVVDRKNV